MEILKQSSLIICGAVAMGILSSRASNGDVMAFDIKQKHWISFFKVIFGVSALAILLTTLR